MHSGADDNNTIELAEAANGTLPVADRRLRVPEPLPVRLVAVEDVRLWTPAGLEPQLDGFYAGILGFEREEGAADIAYRADNHRLKFRVVEAPTSRQDLRPLGIEVHDLNEIERRLIDREVRFDTLKGIVAGRRSLLMTDPAGNWVSVSETVLAW